MKIMAWPKWCNFLKIIEVKVWLLGLEYGYLDLMILYFSQWIKSQRRNESRNKLCIALTDHIRLNNSN